MQNRKGAKRKKPVGWSEECMAHEEFVRQIESRICSEQKNEDTSIIVIDSSSSIVLWNKASERMFGYSAEEVIGKDFNIIIPEEYHSLNKYRMRLMLQTGEARFPETPIELSVKRKDGSEVICEFQPAMLNTKEGIFFSIVVRDITGENPDSLSRHPSNLSMARISTGLHRDLENIVAAAGTSLHADFAVYQKITGDFLYCEAGWNIPEDYKIIKKKKGTVCYDITKKNRQKPVVIRNLDETDFSETDLTVTLNGLKTVVGVPVRSGKKAIGSLCIFYNDDMKPGENELRILSLVSQAIKDKEAFVSTTEMLDQNQRKLEISESNIRRLSRQILLYREEERKNISATLHDEVGSMVVSLSSGLTITEEEIKDGNLDEALLQIIQLKNKLDSSVENIKKMAVDLRPPDLDILGLRRVLEEFISGIEEQAKIKICFTFDLNDADLNDTIATALYRFVQESMNNIIKHAGAHMTTVVLRTEGDSVKLEVSDDGLGFNRNMLDQNSTSKKIGLWGMKMRVQGLGGTLNIESRACKGTRIVIELPLRKESN
jgi:PAS domain S-box-containing protein